MLFLTLLALCRHNTGSTFFYAEKISEKAASVQTNPLEILENICIFKDRFNKTLQSLAKHKERRRGFFHNNVHLIAEAMLLLTHLVVLFK